MSAGLQFVDAKEPASDLTVIACNYLEGTPVVAQGSLAYVVSTCGGQGCGDRIRVLARSRGGGRWVRKWENMKHLHNFRLKTIPPEHPRYADCKECWPEHQELADGLNRRANYWRSPAPRPDTW